MKTKIIILNGVSSCGKTSILRKFQELSNDCYYGVRMDRINDILPKKYLVYQNYETLTEENKKGFYFDRNDKVHKTGKYAKNMIEDFWYIVKSLAERGRNIIVDVVFGLNDLKKVVNILDIEKYDVYIVRVDCEIEELRRREAGRGDRPVGSAEKQISLIDTRYNDLVLDSTNKKVEELAMKLNGFVKSNEARMLLKFLKDNIT